MAKVIKYNLYPAVTSGAVETVNQEAIKKVLTPVTLEWSEAHEQIAKKEAYNGEYTIEDDGVEPTPAERIAELKKQLSATDYKVIKCAESQLLGQEMPYDVAKLHADRQAIRDEINCLEQEK